MGFNNFEYKTIQRIAVNYDTRRSSRFL